ncbi:metallopeptidase family protein [Candidatus Methylomirabilis sp.]|uniref:metallopeptidase family protein n=1 Tax=Candidatus Methylomirabilis sp. TaxID=2032687 RepID=UPI003C719AFA
MSAAKQRIVLSRQEFRQLVSQAIASLPSLVMDRLTNVEVVVRDQPTHEELTVAEIDPTETLFGLYSGIPLTKRSSSYGMVLPDKITLYQRSIEEGCRTKQEIQEQIRTTLLHEIGHHFGLSEDELEEAGYK